MQVNLASTIRYLIAIKFEVPDWLCICCPCMQAPKSIKTQLAPFCVRCFLSPDWSNNLVDSAINNINIYHLSDSALHYSLPKSKRMVRVITDADEKNRILERCHNAPHAAHSGVAATAARVLERYYWKGTYEDVKEWVSIQHACSPISCYLY